MKLLKKPTRPVISCIPLKVPVKMSLGISSRFYPENRGSILTAAIPPEIPAKIHTEFLLAVLPGIPPCNFRFLAIST